MARSLGKAIGEILVVDLKERGLSVSDLDSGDRELKRSLDKLSTPKEIVEVFIEDNWDYPAMMRAVSRSYEAKLITKEQLKKLAGEAYLRRRDFDT